MIGYTEFVGIMKAKLEADGGISEEVMINKGIMKLWLSETGDGVMNSRNRSLNCEFVVLYGILKKAIELGGEMDLGASAAQIGRKIGSTELPLTTIDGFISVEYYGKRPGDTTLRRSTYYAAILDWAGFVTNHRGGYITVNPDFMGEV